MQMLTPIISMYFKKLRHAAKKASHDSERRAVELRAAVAADAATLAARASAAPQRRKQVRAQVVAPAPELGMIALARYVVLTHARRTRRRSCPSGMCYPRACTNHILRRNDTRFSPLPLPVPRAAGVTCRTMAILR